VRLILTHVQPDFDAIASLALAQRLHPGARVCLPESLSPAVRACVELYRDRLDPIDVRDTRNARIESCIVVDTADRTRLGTFAERVTQLPLIVYDHHPAPAAEDALPVGEGIRERVGATVTLLARMLERQDDALPADLASLALLGLHEDTGGFRYTLTTAEDHRAAAWLMSRGGTLNLVDRFLRPPQNDELEAFRIAMLQHANIETLAGRPVAFSSFDWPEYVPDVAGLVHDLIEMGPCDAAILIVGMEDQTLVFARSHGGRFDVAATLAATVGGGGHPGAAFARTDLPREHVMDLVRTALLKHAVPQTYARDIMSTPVRTVTPETLVHEASEQLLAYGHNGMPVVEPNNAGDQVVGVVSRRDLARALQHGLGRSHVAGFMGSPAVTAHLDATLDELEALTVQSGVGRIPIVDGARLVGIVTRSDLLAARHDQRLTPLLHPEAGAAERVLERLRTQFGEVLTNLRQAVPAGAQLYLVGGSVRDALLGVSLKDLDLVLEGAEAGAVLQAAFGPEGNEQHVRHDAFGTATTTLPGGLRIDLAAAREERYAAPGALPTVESSDVRRDLARRDFTINAMAVRLVPEPPTLLDPFGGAQDLLRGTLRTLHPLSFHEDATRIVRGARLISRLGLTFSDEAIRQIARVLASGDGHGVSAERLRSELLLTLQDNAPGRALEVLHEVGALAALYGMEYDAELLQALDRLRLEGLQIPPTAYLLALLLPLPQEEVDTVVQRFHFPARRTQVTRNLRELLAGAEPRDDVLASLGRSGRAVLEAHGEPHQARVRAFERLTGRRRLLGRDLLELGLAPGPIVGEVLGEVARARREGRVQTFEEERALAAELVADARKEGQDTAP